MKGRISHIKNCILSLVILAASFGIGVLLQNVVQEHITAVFVCGGT